jgi:hypothetical protein
VLYPQENFSSSRFGKFWPLISATVRTREIIKSIQIPWICFNFLRFFSRDRSRSSLPVRQPIPTAAASAISRTGSSAGRRPTTAAARPGRPSAPSTVVPPAVRPSGLILSRRPPAASYTNEEPLSKTVKKTEEEVVCSYDIEDSAATAAVVEDQRTAEWVQKIRGDEGSGLTLDRMRPLIKADADRTAGGAGPGRFIPPAYLRRQGGAVVGTENSGAEKEQKGDPFVGQQANLPPPSAQEDDAASSTVSFESCESPPRTATTTSLESLLANRSGGGGVAGKRWPSVSRIPLLAVGQSVLGDRDDRSKDMKNSRLLSLADSCDGVAASKGVRRYNSSVPQRGAVVANDSTGKNELADFSIAGGRLRVRSESPSR